MASKSEQLFIEMGLKDNFTSGIRAINREIKIAQAEFKNASAGITGFGNSMDGLKAKVQNLERIIELQNKKLERSKKVFNDASNNIKTLAQRETELKSKVDSARKAWEDSKESLGENAEETKKLQNEYKSLQKELTSTQTKIRTNATRMQNSERAINRNEAELKQYKAQLKETSRELDKYNTKIGAMIQNAGGIDVVSSKLIGTGKALTTGLTAPLVAAAGLAVKTTISFESAFTGVAKTTNFTATEFENFKQQIIDMSSEIPKSVEEISAVAEAAGQLGIQKENLTEFAETMLKLGDTTNIVSEEAASALAKFANVTKMPQTEFDRLGATIVELGNNFATTEADIVNMGTRIASAGSQAGLSQAEIMSFAAALSSVGLEAEAGGTAFSKFINDMTLAVQTGSDRLNEFAKVAGVSADEFRDAFEDDAAGAINKFIQGLNDTERNGKSAVQILDEMGIKETRLRDTLLRAAGASDTFTQAIETGTGAWNENTALTDEANKRYETLESQLAITKNKLRELADTFGQQLVPFVKEGNEKLGELIDTVNDMDETAIQNLIGLGTALAVIGPALMAVGTGMKVVQGLGGLKAISAGVGSFMGIGALPAAGVVAGGAAAGVGLGNLFEKLPASDFAVQQKMMDTEGKRIDERWKEFQQKQQQNIQQSQQAFDLWAQSFNQQSSEIWNGIVSTAQEIPGKLQESVGTFTGIIGTSVSSAWDSIKDTASEKVSQIGTSVSNGFENAKSAVSEKVSSMVTAAQNGFNNMLNKAKEMPSKFKTAATEMGQGLIDGIKSKASAAKSQVTTTVNNMVNAAKAKVSGWFSIGRNMINGLINGIKSKVSRAINAAKNVVSSAYNAAKDFLDINSPSRIFMALGESTTEGFAVGIQRTADAPVFEIRKMNEKVRKEMDAFLKKNEKLVSNTGTVIDKIVEALQNKYTEAFEKQEAAIENNIDALEKWKEASVNAINERYDAMIAGIDAEIEALDREWQARQRQKEDEDIDEKIQSVKTALEYEHNEDNRAQLQKELENLMDQKKEIEEKREYEDKKDALQQQKEYLNQQKQQELANIQAMYEREKARLNRQLEDLKKNHEEKIKLEKLQAEAVKLIQDKNQKEIIKLLQGYAPKYQLTGQKLGEAMVAGFKPKIKELEKMINAIIAQINAAENSIYQLSSKSAGSSRTVNNNNSKTATYNVTVNNNGSGSEDLETTLRRITFSY